MADQMDYPLEIETPYDVDQEPQSATAGNKLILGIVFLRSILLALIAFANIMPNHPWDVLKSNQTFASPVQQDLLILWVWTIWELVFAVVQITPSCRRTQLVKVITPWFLLTCILNIVVTILISLEMIAFALLVAIVYLGSMLVMVLIADAQPFPSFFELYLVRFPLSVHLGFTMTGLVSLLNLVAHDSSSGSLFGPLSEANQISVGVSSLAALVCLLTMFAVAVDRPDPLVCGVVALSFGFKCLNLNELVQGGDGEGLGRPDYSEIVLEGYMWSMGTIAFLAACLTVLAVPLRMWQRCCLKSEY